MWGTECRIRGEDAQLHSLVKFIKLTPIANYTIPHPEKGDLVDAVVYETFQVSTTTRVLLIISSRFRFFIYSGILLSLVLFQTYLLSVVCHLCKIYTSTEINVRTRMQDTRRRCPAAQSGEIYKVDSDCKLYKSSSRKGWSRWRCRLWNLPSLLRIHKRGTGIIIASCSSICNNKIVFSDLVRTFH